MRGRSRRVVAPVAVAAFLAGAYPAYAWICHPDPVGTRTLVVVGAVESYSMFGTHVDVTYRDQKCAKRAVWNVRAGRPTTTMGPRAACGQAVGGTVAPARPAASVQPDGTVVVRAADGTPLRTLAIPRPFRASHAAVAGRRVVVFVRGPARPERPDRALVIDTSSGKLINSWPLLDRPTSLDVAGDLALFGTVHGHALYALRLSNGRIALVGLNRVPDMPQIDGAGVVYVDDLYKGKRGNGRTTLKFVPTRAVAQRLVNVARPLVTRGPIHAFAMDATRVGVAVDDPERSCDSVIFWNVPWHFDIDVTKLLMPRRLTCPTRGGPRITQIAFGGVGLEWVADYGGTTKLLTATLVNCDIRIVSSGARVAGVAGDGSVLAYALDGRADARGSLALVSLQHHHVDHGVFPGRTLARLTVRALAADAGRVATVDTNGRIELRTARGHLLRALRVPGTVAVALHGDDLVALGGAQLRVLDAASGRVVHAWKVSAGARPELDVHYGVAVIAIGRSVVAVDLATGRRAVVARAPGAVHAQIEAPGIAYRYNAGGHGFVRFVPFAQIERALD
jgi:hypothetical protein